MDQPVKPFTSEGADGRRWIGRLIIAVLLGEALWGLIVSVMNNVVVPWLGDVMGQSSGLPTSFTQRPYNYPELFVSVLEFCIAGLVAAVLNYFFQRPTARRVKTLKSSVPTAPVGPARVLPDAATLAKADPVTPSAPFTVAPAAPAPPVAPAPAARAMAVVPATPVVANPVAAKPLPPAPKAEPAKPKKPKNVYYNIVGEPMPSDDD
jgi:large-conductance mechanosensitive channel